MQIHALTLKASGILKHPSKLCLAGKEYVALQCVQQLP